MKKLLLLLIIFAPLSLKAQSEGFGLGVVLGDPTGLSGKLWLSETNALQGAAAWSVSNDLLYGQVDYLMHKPGLIDVEKGEMLGYFGLGAGLLIGDDFGIAARVPLGLNYHFQSSPLDMFLEVAPGLALIPETDFILGAGLGIRYFF